MPELPEVESVRQGLEQLIIGQRIQSVTVYWDNIIKDPAVEIFKEQLIGQTFTSIKRRGKFLLFEMTDYTLISHLRMEGKYRLEYKDTPLTKHTHVVFELNSDKNLRYLDVRKFGKMSLVEKDKAYQHASLVTLGQEPTEADLRVEQLHDFLKKRKRSIKSCLLDQKMVVGIGNIYADEVLFAAGIHPEKEAQALTIQEIEDLRTAIITIIGEAVASGGTTIRSYENAYGTAGSYQNKLRMYGKANESCVTCGTPIIKTKVAQRGTHYCPVCQN